MPCGAGPKTLAGVAVPVTVPLVPEHTGVPGGLPPFEHKNTMMPPESRALGESRTKTAKLQIESFGSALDLFFLDAGRYPTTAEGLTALGQRPTGMEVWNGPYVKGGKVPPDPWGHPYIYVCPGKHNPNSYDIISMGPDGQEGTDDDITSWQQTNPKP